MKTLTLSLKKKWFDMIKAGIKLEEYRQVKPFWIRRLIENPEDQKHARFKHFDKLVFTLGYPKADDTEKRMEFTGVQIDLCSGKKEWGAVPGVPYFVITWKH